MEHPSWSFQENYDLSINRKSKRPQHELVEMLWRDGKVVLQSQTHREQIQIQKQDHDQEDLRSNTFLQDQETVSWIQYPPDDDPFETDDFSSKFFSTVDSLQRPTSDMVNLKTSPEPPQVMPPPKFSLTDSSSQSKEVRKEQYSVMTVGPSHCGSNQSQNDQDVSMSQDRSKNIEEWLYPNASSSSGGSSGCSFGKSVKASGSNTTDCKRKHKTNNDESVSQSNATGNKSNQRSGSTRRSRAAEVHNLSERRRRDRINERMKALQELIPHCTKTDKASILDEAIDYMKSLQLHLQMMWMGNGMTSPAPAPMMFPGVQSPPFIHQIQSPLQLSRFPVMDRSTIQNNPGLICPNPIQNPVFSNRFARYIGGFPQMQAASQMQSMEMLRFSSPAIQQGQQPSAPTKTTNGPRLDH